MIFYLDKRNQICINGENLEFLSNFLKLAVDTFVEQINTDKAYLTPGQNLFDQMIATIRGIVEVEQAKALTRKKIPNASPTPFRRLTTSTRQLVHQLVIEGWVFFYLDISRKSQYATTTGF